MDSKKKKNIYTALAVSDQKPAGKVVPKCTSKPVLSPAEPAPPVSPPSVSLLPYEQDKPCLYCIHYGHHESNCFYKNPNYNPEELLRQGKTPPSRPCIICTKSGKTAYHASTACPDRCVARCDHVHHNKDCRIPPRANLGKPPLPQPGYESVPLPELHLLTEIAPVEECALCKDRFGKHRSEECPMRCKMECKDVHADFDCRWHTENMEKITELASAVIDITSYFDLLFMMRHHPNVYYAHTQVPHVVRQNILRSLFEKPVSFPTATGLPTGSLMSVAPVGSLLPQNTSIDRFRRFLSLLPNRIHSHLQRVYQCGLGANEKAIWADELLSDCNPMGCRYCPRCFQKS